ncbi:hypothetical protein TrVE_jg6465 [Triparma verrucosa]|uniref:Uncharacterized protein n=1 Tax=Triparma verrucosa TaxID=1606542 RepID=A0A9W7EZN0_9STRA|nr:hypothetical protein TrVE_jg6465 [Triparma verrucosa]
MEVTIKQRAQLPLSPLCVRPNSPITNVNYDDDDDDDSFDHRFSTLTFSDSEASSCSEGREVSEGVRVRSSENSDSLSDSPKGVLPRSTFTFTDDEGEGSDEGVVGGLRVASPPLFTISLSPHLGFPSNSHNFSDSESSISSAEAPNSPPAFSAGLADSSVSSDEGMFMPNFGDNGFSDEEDDDADERSLGSVVSDASSGGRRRRERRERREKRTTRRNVRH